MFHHFRAKPATALAAILGCALLATSNPVTAREKPKKEAAEKGTKIAISKGFAPSAKKMGDATTAKDATALQAAIAEAEAAASTNEDRYWLAFYKLQLGILNRDQALQAQGLDTMLATGLTPPEQLGVYSFFSGNFAYGAKDYAKAIERLEAAKAAGATEKALNVILMDSYLNAGQVDKGWAVAKAEIEARKSAGEVPSEELFVRPAQAFQKANRTNDLLEALTMRVEHYPAPATWRNTLYILLQQGGGNKDMTLDILRLMRATGAMTERPEYTEYAALATEAGFPGEVVAVVRHGQGKGVIPANDKFFGGILETQLPRAQTDAAALAADAAKPSTLSNPRTARATADALVGNGEYAKAIPLYQASLNANADPVVQYRLGVAQVLAGQNEAGIATLAKVQGDRARLARLWSIHAKTKQAPAASATAS